MQTFNSCTNQSDICQSLLYIYPLITCQIKAKHINDTCSFQIIHPCKVIHSSMPRKQETGWQSGLRLYIMRALPENRKLDGNQACDCILCPHSQKTGNWMAIRLAVVYYDHTLSARKQETGWQSGLRLYIMPTHFVQDLNAGTVATPFEDILGHERVN